MPTADRVRKRDELVEEFGLGRLLNSKAAVLSGGEKRRLEIARALIMEPRLILLDEPFSGLDQEGQELLKNCIREFAAGGRTVLLVTHLREIGRELAGASIEITDGYISARTGLGGEGGS